MNDLVVVSAGGRDNRSLVAYRAGTGEFVWGSGTDGAGYSSPCLVTLAGAAQILIFNWRRGFRARSRDRDQSLEIPLARRAAPRFDADRSSERPPAGLQRLRRGQ